MVSFHGVLWPILLVIGFHWLEGAGLGGLQCKLRATRPSARAD